MSTKFAACLAAGFIAAALAAPAWSAPSQIKIDDQAVFPESMGAAPDGTLYIGSSNHGRIYRALPGQAYAEPWISKEEGDFHRVLGVLPDKAHNLLWVCDNITAAKQGFVKSFNLKTGKKVAAYEFPGGGACNDIAVKGDTTYITDFMRGRVLKLAPGAKELTVFFSTSDPADVAIDGIVWTKDGQLYVNSYSGAHLMRLTPSADGSTATAAMLTPSMPLSQPDGMRLTNDGRIALIEGRATPKDGPKEGRVEIVTIKGDNADINVLKSGLEIPAAVTPIGHDIWVVESKFDYQRNPAMKGMDPGDFYVIRVPLK